MYRRPVSFKASQQKRADAFVDCHIGRAMSTWQDLGSTQEDFTDVCTQESQTDSPDTQDFAEEFMQPSSKKHKGEAVQEDEQAATDDAARGNGSGIDASVKNPQIPQLWGTSRCRPL